MQQSGTVTSIAHNKWHGASRESMVLYDTLAWIWRGRGCRHLSCRLIPAGSIEEHSIIPSPELEACQDFHRLFFIVVINAPNQGNPKKGRVYLVWGSFGTRAHRGREIQQQAHETVLGITENSHLQTQIRSGEKEWETSKPSALSQKLFLQSVQLYVTVKTSWWVFWSCLLDPNSLDWLP